MQSRLLTRYLLAVAGSSLLSLSCKSMQNGSAVKDAVSSQPGLDVNDVSLLMPLPRTAAELGGMIPLSTLNTAGKPLFRRHYLPTS